MRRRGAERDLVMNTLLFLIADFHDMTPKQPGCKWRYISANASRTSPTLDSSEKVCAYAG